MDSSMGHRSETRPPTTRNSSIELLRIISMYLILAHHFVVHNGTTLSDYPMDVRRFFYQFIMLSGGKVGVVIFFSISVWFLLDKEQTIKSSLRRVWLLEREVLFWSIVLSCAFMLFYPDGIGKQTFVRSLMPLTQQIWWYPTAYAIFLAILPYLSKGLRALGKGLHTSLAVTLLVIWGVLGLLPGTPRMDNVLGFLYLFVLISAYKWYYASLSSRVNWAFVVVGGALVLFCSVLSAASRTMYKALMVTSLSATNSGLNVAADWALPVVLLGFGVFSLAVRKEFHNQVINRLAKSAFAVYLITDYPPSRELLWSH